MNTGNPLRIIALHLAICFFCCFSAVSSEAAPAEGQPWNVIYLEAGPLADYRETLAGTAQGLLQLGLINGVTAEEIEAAGEEEKLWALLAQKAGGRLHFPADGFYSSGWDQAVRAKNKEAVLKRIRETKDVDMVIAMGTRAGIDMTSEELEIPVLVMSVTDAVAAGIAAAPSYSGREWVHAETEPNRYKRMLETFHELFPVKKIGIPYENTPESRSSAGIGELMQTAEALNVEVIESYGTFRGVSKQENAAELTRCVKDLIAKGAESIFFPFTTTDPEYMPEITDLLIPGCIPSFAQAGPEFVECGVLMSMTQSDFKDIGMFEANVIKAVLKGEKPGEINQIFMISQGLVINLDTATDIAWAPSQEILASADQFFRVTKRRSKHK